MKRKISVVTACFNEEGNVEALYLEVKRIFELLPDYEYEHIFIDNASSDNTVPILKKLAAKDKNIKVIVNAMNFGHIRSPFHALLQASGDAVISLVADFQDPPSMIIDFIKEWESGYKIVIGVKNKSKESKVMYLIRSIYYRLVKIMSTTDHISHFTGFGLFDKSVMEIIKTYNDPYPYFRGIISEIGFARKEIHYEQPKRLSGKTKNNLYTLYDMAMLGFVNHSKVPLRLSVFTGFFVAVMSLLTAFIYLILKLVFWDTFEFGLAPLIISIFFFSAVQLLFLGIIGEYIGAIYTQVKNRPLVVEKERINF